MDMKTFLLTVYVLIWPVIVTGTLFVVVRAFVKEWLQAKREGREII